MASMEDLIATMSSGLQAGPQGNDLKDLHAKLTQTIQSTPHYRPIPPTSTTSAVGTHTSAGPLPPPAPASSWNSPQNMPALGGFASSPSFGQAINSGSPLRQGSWSAAFGNAQGQGQVQGQGQGKSQYSGSNTNGLGSASIPGPKPTQIRNTNGVEEARPYHATVLPVKASPKETGGFDQDAFRPLWNGGERGSASGSSGSTGQRSQADWGGFRGEKW